MRCLVEGSRSCHERLHLRGLGKKTEGCIGASSWCCCVGKEEEEGKTSLWCCCVGGVAILGKKKKIEARCCWERRRNRGQEVRAT